MINSLSNSSLLRMCAMAVLTFVFAISVLVAVPAQKAEAQISVPDTSELSDAELELVIIQLRLLILQLLADLGAGNGGSSGGGGGGSSSGGLVVDDMSAEINFGDTENIAFIELDDSDEGRHLNEVTLRFNSLSDEHPADVFETLRLEVEFGNASSEFEFEYEISNRSDWDEVFNDEYEINLYDSNDTGFGLFIPAGEEVYVEMEIETRSDAEESDWVVTTETIALHSNSRGDHTIGENEQIVFEVFEFDRPLNEDIEIGIDFIDSDADLDGTEIEFEIEFEVSAADEDILVFDDARVIDDGEGLTAGTAGLFFQIVDSRGEVVEDFRSLSIEFDSTADNDNGFFVIEEGDTEDLSLDVTFEPSNDGFYRLKLLGLSYEIDGDVVTQAIDSDTFKTPFARVGEGPDAGGEGGGSGSDGGSSGGGSSGDGEGSGGDGPGAGSGSGGGSSAPSNTADDQQRKDDLEEIADAMFELFEDTGSFRVNGGGFIMSSDRSIGNGWFNYSCAGVAGCRYGTSTASVLQAGGYLSSGVIDPTGAEFSDSQLEHTGYLLQVSDLPGGRSTDYHFTVWANLDEPTSADEATLDSCHFSTYDNYPSSRPEAQQLNYCVSGTVSEKG